MSTHGYLTIASTPFAIYLRGDAGFPYMTKHINNILLEIFPDKNAGGWTKDAFCGEIIPAMIELDKRMYKKLARRLRGIGNFSDSTRSVYAQESKEATREKGKYHLCSTVRAFHALYEIDFTTKLVHMFEPMPKAGWGTVYRIEEYPKKMRHVSSYPWFESPALYFTPGETNDEGTYHKVESTPMGRVYMKYYGDQGRQRHYFDRMDEKQKAEIANVCDLMEAADSMNAGL